MVYRLILLCNGLLGERNKYLQNIQFTNVDAYAKIQAQTNNYALFYNLIKKTSRNGGIGRRNERGSSQRLRKQTNIYAHFYNLIKHISRNGGIGRRKGLKIPRWQHRIGSTPIFGTNKKSLLWVIFLFSHNRGLTCPVTRLAYKSAIADGRPLQAIFGTNKKNHLRFSMVVFVHFCSAILFSIVTQEEVSNLVILPHKLR